MSPNLEEGFGTLLDLYIRDTNTNLQYSNVTVMCPCACNVSLFPIYAVGSLLQVMMRLPLYKRAAVTVACCIVLYCVLSVLLAVSVVPELQDSAMIQLEEHPTSLLCRRLLSSEIDSTVNMTVQERAQVF